MFVVSSYYLKSYDFKLYNISSHSIVKSFSIVWLVGFHFSLKHKKSQVPKNVTGRYLEGNTKYHRGRSFISLFTGNLVRIPLCAERLSISITLTRLSSIIINITFIIQKSLNLPNFHHLYQILVVYLRNKCFLTSK